MKSIEDLEFDTSTRIYRSQQMFLFSYYARGINFIDLAKLKFDQNLKADILTYVRSKNKRHYNYKLHSKAFAIVQLFRSNNLSNDSGYVFPILNSGHNTPKKIDTRIDSGLKDLNEDLRSIGKMINLDTDLTSYVARHSFASNLRRKVHISFIQEALGHETEAQTMTYLDEIDDSILSASIEEALK